MGSAPDTGPTVATRGCQEEIQERELSCVYVCGGVCVGCVCGGVCCGICIKCRALIVDADEVGWPLSADVQFVLSLFGHTCMYM